MVATLTNYMGDYLLQQHFTNVTRWLALFTDNPTVTGSFANEVTGGGYARKSITWTTPSAKATANSNAITFSNMPAVTGINYAGIADASSGGNLLAFVAIGPYNVASGGSLVVPVNDLTLTLM